MVNKRFFFHKIVVILNLIAWPAGKLDPVEKIPYSGLYDKKKQ